MKKMIKEYAKNLPEKGKLYREMELAEEHAGKEIRVCRSSKCGGNTEYYYYEPETEEVFDDPVFVGTGNSHYGYKAIGLIEVVVCHDQGDHWIQLERVVLPEDEDLTYADNYEEKQFPDLPRIDLEELWNSVRNYQSMQISECVVCSGLVLPLQEKFDFEELWNLSDDNFDYCICPDCGAGHTLQSFLDKMSDRGDWDEEEIEGWQEYIQHCGLSLDDSLFP